MTPEKSLNQAIINVMELISFFLVLGYDPKAAKKIGRWVDEEDRNEEFTKEVDYFVRDLEDVLEFLKDRKQLSFTLIENDIETLKEQIDEIRGIDRENKSRALKAKLSNKCEYCSKSYCAHGSIKKHPAKPGKNHK